MHYTILIPFLYVLEFCKGDGNHGQITSPYNNTSCDWSSELETWVTLRWCFLEDQPFRGKKWGGTGCVLVVTYKKGLTYKKAARRKVRKGEEKNVSPKPECGKSAQRIIAINSNWLPSYPHILPQGVVCLITRKGHTVAVLEAKQRGKELFSPKASCRSFLFYKSMHQKASHSVVSLLDH